MGLRHLTHDEDGVPHVAEHEVQVSKGDIFLDIRYKKPQCHTESQDCQPCTGTYEEHNSAKSSKTKVNEAIPSSKVCMKSCARLSSMLS